MTWTPPPFPKRERAQEIEVYFCSVCGYAAGILDYDRIRHEHFENDRRCAHGHWRRERYVLAESVVMASDLDTLLSLYGPNVPEGNYLGDAGRRGANKGIRRSIVALGLATDEEVTEHFKRLDDEAYARTEARIAALEAGGQ